MKWLTIGAVMGGLAVTLGAFGAHGLDTHFEEKYRETEVKSIAGHQVPASWKYLQDFKTGVLYHMFHVVGLIAVGLLSRSQRKKSLDLAGKLFIAGIVLFSGALYVLSIAGPHWLGIRWGIITPFGGLAFIGGWIALAIGACPCGEGGSPQETDTPEQSENQ